MTAPPRCLERPADRAKGVRSRWSALQLL